MKKNGKTNPSGLDKRYLRISKISGGYGVNYKFDLEHKYAIYVEGQTKANNLELLDEKIEGIGETINRTGINSKKDFYIRTIKKSSSKGIKRDPVNADILERVKKTLEEKVNLDLIIWEY